MTFPTDFSIAPAELGKAAEDAGFETLLFAEHTHIPANRATPNPRGGELPEKYWHTHDPFVALATVRQPQSAANVLASFAIESGRAGLKKK